LADVRRFRRAHNQTARDRIIRAHRIAGYLFIALFCFMTWFMVLKVKDVPDELPCTRCCIS
jgi:hypothetical protein